MNMFDNTSPRGFNSQAGPRSNQPLTVELSQERERSSGLARQIAVLESALVQQQNEYEQKAFRQQQTMQEEINELDEALQEERERNAQNTRNISALESACVNEREKQSKNVLALRAQLQKAQEQLIDQTNQHDYLQRKLSSEIEILRAQLLAKRSDVGQEGSAPENALVELENEKHRTATLLAKSMELEARVAKLDELRTRQESEIEMLQKSIQGYQKEMGFIEDGLVDERERTLAQARTIHSLEEALLKQKKSQMTITSELGNTTRTSMSSNTHVHETEIRRLQDLLNDVETQLHSKIETQQSLEAINKKLNDRIQEQSKTIETLMERTMETDRENKLSQVAHPAQSGDVLQQLLILECEKTRKLEDTIARLTVQTQKKREEQQEEHERELRQLEEEVRTWKRRASELAEDIKHSDILLHENAVS